MRAQPQAAAAPPRQAAPWVFLALVLILLGAQTTWSQFDARQHVEAEARDWLENHSKVLHDTLERDLHSIDAALRYLSEHGPQHMAQPGGIGHFAAELVTLSEVLPNVRALLVLDARGTMLASNRAELIDRDFAERDYFAALRRAPSPDRLHVTPPFTTLLGVYTLALSRPVYDARGEFAGVVAAVLEPGKLAEKLRRMHSPPGTRLSILHGDGILLTMVPERQGMAAEAAVANPDSLYRRHRASGQPASYLTGPSAFTGAPTAISLRTLQPAGLGMTAPLVVATARDQADILAPWREESRHHLVVFLLLAAAGTLALGLHERRRHDLERKLRREEEQGRHLQLSLQRFLDHLPALAYVKDGDLRARMVNRSFLSMLGKEPAEVIGKTNAELFPAAFAAKISADDRQVLASGEATTIEETFDGREYETTKFVIADDRGPRQLGGITFDITERKRAERELAARLEELRALNHRLEEAHHQLLQSEKMAALGQLAAGVAHEINNPVGFVGTNLRTLQNYLRDLFRVAAACEEAAAQARVPEDFVRIQAVKDEVDFDYLRNDVFHLLEESVGGLARVKKIVQDLKDFSRPGEVEWQLADLRQGLDSTLNIVAHEIKYKCAVRKEYGDIPPIRCLPAELNQVFLNLLTNAAQAIPDKGEIVIRTGRDGDEVFVAVGDNGQGIAPEHLGRIFDPFFSTKPVGEGTGLGLSLSYAIVQKHGGRIEVESRVGAGTTFTVLLPIERKTPTTDTREE
jgi:PAS domain S-box-containing protein